MTNFEKIISEMTIGNVAHSMIESEYPLGYRYKISNGKKYCCYEDALKAELNGLKKKLKRNVYYYIQKWHYGLL